MLFQATIIAALCSLPNIQASPIRTSTSIDTLEKRAGWSNPEPCQGNCSWIHDPSIIKKGGTYYRFSTSGNIAIATASSLNGPWTYKGALLQNGPKIHVADGQDVWAPDVNLVNGVYYVYYAVSTMGSQHSDIGVATSTTLDPGTWEDHGSIGLPQSDQYNLIDPNLFQDNGQLRLTFGSYWKDIFQTTLKNPPLSYSGSTPTNIIYNGTTPQSVAEGATQFKWDNKYYIFYSVGACCNTPPNLAKPGDEYRIMVCRSDSATGPFVDQSGRNCLTQSGGTLLLGSHDDVYAPGGQSVIKDGDRAVLVYHYVKPSVGYAAQDFFFGFNYLNFNNGWPSIA